MTSTDPAIDRLRDRLKHADTLAEEALLAHTALTSPNAVLVQGPAGSPKGMDTTPRPAGEGVQGSRKHVRSPRYLSPSVGLRGTRAEQRGKA